MAEQAGDLEADPSRAHVGHFLIGEAIFTGLREAVTTMRQLMDEGRAGATGAISAMLMPFGTTRPAAPAR